MTNPPRRRIAALKDCHGWLAAARGAAVEAAEDLEGARLARALELEQLIADAIAFADRLAFVCEADARHEEAQR